MNKNLLLLSVFWILIFAPFLIRESLTGYDSFAFLNTVCQDNYAHNPGQLTTPLANLLFSVLPCNLMVIKLLLFILGLVSLLLVAKGGELIDKDNGWLAGLFVFISPSFVQHFVKFENDVFATPLIYLSMLVLLHAKLYSENRNKKLLLASVILGIAALIWNAAAIVAVGAAVEFAILFMAFLPVFYFYGKNIFAAIASNPIIKENAPGFGVVLLFVLNLGFFYSPLSAMTLFLGMVAFLNAKYVILVLPLLAWGLVKAFQDSFFGKYRNYVIGMAIVLGLMAGIIGVTLFPPTPAHWDAVNAAIEWHNVTGKPIINDFWYGYLLDYSGYVSENYAFFEADYLDDPTGNIVLTDEEIRCELLDSFDTHYVYEC